jgi:two-component system OmpR family sensor kinase
MSAESAAPLSATILSVDDQPANLRVVVECLEAAGYRVVVAQSGEECIERALFVRPDLILMDVHMPGGIDGFEACRRLRQLPETRDVPVVFMTLLDELSQKLEGFAAGGVDYVTKPLESAEVLARIRTHVALYALRRELAGQNAMLQQEVQARERAQAALLRTNVELEQLAVERAIRARAEGESAGLRRLLDERDQMLAERDEMLHLLSHEVRQPLNNASAALESASAAIAAMGDAPTNGIGRPLVRARHVLDHVIGTLNNALAAATMLTSGHTEAAVDCDLDTLLGLVVHDVAADERHRIDVERTDAPRTVHVLPVLMRLALCNLLTNALAYSPRDTTVLLRVADCEEPLGLLFEVRDAGSGIPAELLPRVFDKGSRGSNVGAVAGAGLGLHIVRRVVELHRGSLEILPNIPRGSIVRMVIPQGIEV